MIAWLLFSTGAWSQSTQGLIAGRVSNSVTGRPIAGATVICTSNSIGFTSSTRTDSFGYYYFPQLSPRTYELSVRADKYQAQEVNELELPVAGRLELNWQIRPLADVWEAGQYRSVLLPGKNTVLTFYGPDVDMSRSTIIQDIRPSLGALDSSVSQTVDAVAIADLPLAGRDVYTMLVTQPGVTADTTTSRSLGLSTNGQRPSASNFLLDGIEANNYLVSGPLSPVAPEAIQEYRFSTNNFSAEFGGTTGYIANAVTRAGTNEWHGLAYFDLKNTKLNANDFQSNLQGASRTPVHESEPGFQVGGPLWRKNLFISASWDYLRSRSRAPAQTYTLPTTALLALTAPGSLSRKLLTEFPGPILPGPSLTATRLLAPPVSVNRPMGLARVDRIFAGGKYHLMGRFEGVETSRPDFRWTPFAGLTSGIDELTRALAISFDASIGTNLVNEFRFGNTFDNLNLGRAHPEIPLLTPADGSTVPGGAVFSRFQNRTTTWQLVDDLTFTRGRHLTTMGGGILLRGISGILTAGAEGQYGFATISDFAADKPNLFRIPLDRQALPAFSIPRFDRDYRLNSFFLFIQDTFRVAPNLTLNYGLRYDSFGAPVNVGDVKDAIVQLGPGDSFGARLAGSSLVRPHPGDERLYTPDHNDFAPRVGFSWTPSGHAATVIRGAAGLFYDRMLDNVWQNVRNNNFVLPTAFPITASQTNYLAPVSSVVGAYQGQPVSTLFSDPAAQLQRAPITMFQPGLRSPYVESWFIGLEQPLGHALTVESTYAGSGGRKLMTTDVVNRIGNSGPGPISYRANQGSSSYNSLSTVVRYRGTWANFEAAHTWSHAIDNQSEILRGDYFNLSASRLTATPSSSGFSAFSRQYDSSADRGNADFDQRHNLVLFSVWNLPAPQTKAWAPLRNWKVSQLAAFRSGVPFTIYATAPNQAGILNNRVNLVNPSAVYATAGPIGGGERLLNAAAFSAAPLGTLGNTGRNAFRGPGFWNLDLSLSRSFALPFAGEGGRLTIRADAFNVFNHANLNLPGNILTLPTFGIARFGRAAAASGLPVLSPVNDTSRQIQLILRLQF